ncbi:MAG: geranylgeranyl reductase family protein [Candidatus Helarchaeota archaeon]
MRYDVVISGAGPSGCYCAQVLAKAGYKVALIERDRNWRKPCGGALNPIVFEFYPQLKKLDLPRLSWIVMHSVDGHSIEYKSPDMEPGAVVDRLKFDNFIRDIAIENGVELFDKNISYDFILRNRTKVGVKTKTKSGVNEFHGKIMIIADGMSSKLALKSGIRSPWKTSEIALAKCSILEGEHFLKDNRAYIFFRPNKGYGWIFPLGDGKINIGTCFFGENKSSFNPNEAFNEFLRDPQIKKYLDEKECKTLWSAAYPFPSKGVFTQNLYDDNLMVIGDAGGFVSPISGEGINTALQSANVAAQTAIKALEIGDFSKNLLKSYKNNAEIKTIVRNFKMRLSMVEFFYENNGANLNKMLALAENDPEFRAQVIDIFTSKAIKAPSKEFILKIKKA